jgi:hypothetical protein
MEDFRSGKVIRGQAGSAGMMSMTSMMMGSRSGAEHIEGRLAYVKAELKITDVQTAQWDVFAAVTSTNAKSMSDPCPRLETR